MAYAREEAVNYQQAIAERDNALYDARVQAIYWKRTTEERARDPGVRLPRGGYEQLMRQLFTYMLGADDRETATGVVTRLTARHVSEQA